MNRKTTESKPHRPATTARAGGRKGLDRQQVLQAARDLCGQQGIEQLSIRELADRLGIRPPSVYAHFKGLGEIRRALALWGHRALAEQLRNSAVGLSGEDALLALGRAYLAFIRAEPGLYSATVPTPDESDVELRAAADEWLAVFHRILAAIHPGEEERIHALRGIRSIVHGFGMLEAHGAFRTRYDRDASFQIVLQTFVSAVAKGDGPPA